MADLIVEGAARWLARLLQAPALNVIQPAVVNAAQAAILESSVAEICPTMAAMQPKQTRPAAIIAE